MLKILQTANKCKTIEYATNITANQLNLCLPNNNTIVDFVFYILYR